MYEGQVVGGPYEFGENPPVELMGWAGPAWANWAWNQLATATYEDRQGVQRPHFVTLQDLLASVPQGVESLPFIWEFEKQLNSGRCLPTLKQLIGDCVSFGATQAAWRQQVFLRAWLGYEINVRQPYPPWIYGTSRVQIGGGQLGNSDGSLGSWAVAAMQKYGVLWADDQGVPPYSGSVAKQWGKRPGPPQELFPLASDNLLVRVAPVTNVNDLRTMLKAKHPCTVASNRGFKMQPINRGGYHVFVPSGNWAHQMCWLDWCDENGGMAYRLNSWGEDAHGQPLNGEPAGGAWNLATDIEQEFKTQRDMEVFALQMIVGDPGKSDWSVG